MIARALIAAPLPPTSTWQLLRDLRDLPEGFGVFGSVQIGRAESPALDVQTPEKRLRSRLIAQLEADGIAVEQWRVLFALFARMDAAQRRRLIGYAAAMLQAEALPSEAASQGAA